MSEILTLRVSSETKRLMEEMGLNWSEELRKYIEGRIKSFRLHGLLPEIFKNADKIKVKGDSTLLIREGRDTR
jgi:hypothetical protein